MRSISLSLSAPSGGRVDGADFRLFPEGAHFLSSGIPSLLISTALIFAAQLVVVQAATAMGSGSPQFIPGAQLLRGTGYRYDFPCGTGPDGCGSALSIELTEVTRLDAAIDHVPWLRADNSFARLPGASESVRRDVTTHRIERTVEQGSESDAARLDWSVSSEVFVGIFFPYRSARTEYSETFRVDRPAWVTISGVVEAREDPTGRIASSARASVLMVADCLTSTPANGICTNPGFRERVIDNGRNEVLVTLALETGIDYRVIGSASANGPTSIANIDLSFTLTPRTVVPEPASGVLLLLGLAGLSESQRRRERLSRSSRC